MSLLRRLYGYLRNYKAWATLAFGSMVVFALSQAMLMGLIKPLIDVVLTPAKPTSVERTHLSREEAVKQVIIDNLLRRGRPEGQRGWVINNVDAAQKSFMAWWEGSPKEKAKRILMALLIVFIVRAFTSFFSEYAFQKVGLSTVRDLRNELYEHIIHQSHRFFSERSTGEMVSRVVSDADAIQAAVSTRMGDLFQESITLFGLVILIFWMNA